MDRLTSVQLSEWEAYDRIDPIGTWRDDYRMASLQATMINIHNACNTEEGKTPTATNPSDFLPIWDKFERERLNEQAEELKQTELRQSVEQIKNNLFAAFGLKKSNYIEKDGKRIRIQKPKQ